MAEQKLTRAWLRENLPGITTITGTQMLLIRINDLAGSHEWYLRLQPLNRGKRAIGITCRVLNDLIRCTHWIGTVSTPAELIAVYELVAQKKWEKESKEKS